MNSNLPRTDISQTASFDESLMRAPGEVSRRIFDVCFVRLEARRYLSQRHRQFDSLATVKISSVISFRYREEECVALGLCIRIRSRDCCGWIRTYECHRWASTLYRLSGRRWKGNLALSTDNNFRELSTL